MQKSGNSSYLSKNYTELVKNLKVTRIIVFTLSLLILILLTLNLTLSLLTLALLTLTLLTLLVGQGFMTS